MRSSRLLEPPSGGSTMFCPLMTFLAASIPDWFVVSASTASRLSGLEGFARTDSDTLPPPRRCPQPKEGLGRWFPPTRAAAADDEYPRCLIWLAMLIFPAARRCAGVVIVAIPRSIKLAPTSWHSPRVCNGLLLARKLKRDTYNRLSLSSNLTLRLMRGGITGKTARPYSRSRARVYRLAVSYVVGAGPGGRYCPEPERVSN